MSVCWGVNYLGYSLVLATLALELTRTALEQASSDEEKDTLLGNLGGDLGNLCLPQEALTATEEAVRIRCELAERNPSILRSTDQPDLMMS